MKLVIGGHSANALLDRLQNNGVELNDFAKRYINDLKYSVTSVSTTLEIKFITAEELGFAEGGTLNDIQAAAAKVGLELCPPDTALYLRICYLDQEETPGDILTIGDCPEGTITIASRPVSNIAGIHKGFYLRNSGGQLWLRGYECDEGHIWPSISMFAFAVKKDNI
ncbi:MAG: hypothetical protein IJC56_00875 [Clostridia bacterium]|nr:hypothetical protein [Clostridia bacterium]